MLNRLERVREDLTLQKKKLEDMRDWGSAEILTQAQAAAVVRLEELLGELEKNKKEIEKSEYEAVVCLE